MANMSLEILCLRMFCQGFFFFLITSQVLCVYMLTLGFVILWDPGCMWICVSLLYICLHVFLELFLDSFCLLYFLVFLFSLFCLQSFFFNLIILPWVPIYFLRRDRKKGCGFWWRRGFIGWTCLDYTQLMAFKAKSIIVNKQGEGDLELSPIIPCHPNEL